MDIPSVMNQTRIPAGGWHRRPRPHAHLCLRLGAGLSVRPALTAGGLPTTVSRAEQTRPTAHAHHRRQAQAPPPWGTTKAGAGVRAVPPSAARAPGFLQRAMLDLTVLIQAGSGTLKKGREGAVGQFLKNTQLRPYTTPPFFCMDLSHKTLPTYAQPVTHPVSLGPLRFLCRGDGQTLAYVSRLVFPRCGPALEASILCSGGQNGPVLVPCYKKHCLPGGGTRLLSVQWVLLKVKPGAPAKSRS